MALTGLWYEHGFKLDLYDINLYIVPNTISIRFGSHTQKLCIWFFGPYSIIFMKVFLDVHGNQMKIVKTGSKISNKDISISLKIWHWLAYGMRMVLNWIYHYMT